MRFRSDSVVNPPSLLSVVVISGSSSDLSWRRARFAAAFACLDRSRSRLSKVVRRVANGTPSPDRERTAGTQYQRPRMQPVSTLGGAAQAPSSPDASYQCTRFAPRRGIRLVLRRAGPCLIIARIGPFAGD